MKNKKNLLDKMKEYKYGSYGMNNISFNDTGEFVEIKNFYSGVGKTGVCNEQNSYFDKKNKDMDFVKAVGTEPNYFNGKGANHYFLVAPNGKLPKDFYSSPIEKQKEVLEKLDSTIVDSSFKVVESLKNSDYTINSIVKKIPVFKDAIFDNYSLKPLGIKTNGDLLYIRKSNNDFSIFVQKKGDSKIALAAPLEKLAQLAKVVRGNSDLTKTVSKLSKAYSDFKFKK